MKIAVYSVFCGATPNATFSGAKVDPVFPHYFFTNNSAVAKRAEAAGWKAQLMPLPVTADGTESCMQAKGPKVQPWLYHPLENYDYTIFRDDKMIGVDFRLLPGIIAKMHEHGRYAAYPVHPRNVVEEILDSMPQPRYYAQRRQIARFVAEKWALGFKPCNPVHYGCNVIVRDMRHPDTKPSGDLWARYIEQCGIQDQISFHFVAQKFPAILPIGQEFGFRHSEVQVPEID